MTKEEIMQAIESMTVLELSELVKKLKLLSTAHPLRSKRKSPRLMLMLSKPNSKRSARLLRLSK